MIPHYLFDFFVLNIFFVLFCIFMDCVSLLPAGLLRGLDWSDGNWLLVALPRFGTMLEIILFD